MQPLGKVLLWLSRTASWDLVSTACRTLDSVLPNISLFKHRCREREISETAEERIAYLLLVSRSSPRQKAREAQGWAAGREVSAACYEGVAAHSEDVRRLRRCFYISSKLCGIFYCFELKPSLQPSRTRSSSCSHFPRRLFDRATFYTSNHVTDIGDHNLVKENRAVRSASTRGNFRIEFYNLLPNLQMFYLQMLSFERTKIVLEGSTWNSMITSDRDL